MATAVAIVAIVVCLFVPAVLVLAGRAVLWLPRWLDRILPHVSIEGEEYFAEPGAAGVSSSSPPR